MVADFNIIFMRIYLEPIIWNGTDCFDGIIISNVFFLILSNFLRLFTLYKNFRLVVAGCFSCLECCPVHQKVTSSIPGQGTYGRQLIDVSVLHCCWSLLSLPLSLKSTNISLNED